MSRRRVHEEEEVHNAERWLLTYSDMITLLMVLFIVLFALGQMNIRKFNAFAASFHTSVIQPAPVKTGGVGVLSAENSVKLQLAPQNTPTLTPQTSESKALNTVGQHIESALQAAGLAGAVTLSHTADGLVVTIATDKILFATDSATLLPLGSRIIDVIRPELAGIPNDLDIEGHTDNQPITGGRYDSNWSLSTARAVAVLDQLQAAGIPAGRMVATGFADTRPLVPNDTAAHRSENRRVEIVVLANPIAS